MTTKVSSLRTSDIGVLGERNMRWYLGGQLVSLTGTMLQSAVLSLLIIKLTGKTDAAYWVGVVWALGLLPGIFLGPFAGVFLDRSNKKNILIVTGLLGIAQALTLAYLTHVGRITIAEINLLAVLMGIVNAIDGPGRNAIIKDAVLHAHNVRKASKMFTSLYNLAQVAGPGLAGFLVLSFGYSFTFVLNALSFVALIVALLKMKFIPRVFETASAETENRGTWNLVRSGGRYILSEPSIAICVVLTSVVWAFGFSYYAILAVIARDMFNGNPIVYSHLAASSGVGSFLGALVVIKFDERFSHTFLVAGGAFLAGTALFVLSKMGSVHPAMVLVAATGFSLMVCFSTLRSSIIHLARQELTGVVMGFTFTFFYGGMMLGSFGAGYIANRFGCSTELSICGVALGITGLSVPLLPGVKRLNKKN